LIRPQLLSLEVCKASEEGAVAPGPRTMHQGVYSTTIKSVFFWDGFRRWWGMDPSK
jgi:hypothetical protein